MVKQILAFVSVIIFSIAIVLAMPHAQHGLELLIAAHNWIAETLTDVFSGGPTGNLIRQTLALFVIPVLVSLVPVLIYLIAKRSWFPYFIQVVWVIWLVQTAALVIQYKVAT